MPKQTPDQKLITLNSDSEMEQAAIFQTFRMNVRKLIFTVPSRTTLEQLLDLNTSLISLNKAIVNSEISKRISELQEVINLYSEFENYENIREYMRKLVGLRKPLRELCESIGIKLWT